MFLWDLPEQIKHELADLSGSGAIQDLNLLENHHCFIHLTITPLLNVRLGINDRLMSHNGSKWRRYTHTHTHTHTQKLKIKRGHHAAFTYTQLDFENSIKSDCSSCHMGPFQQQAADPFFLLAHSLWQIWSGVLHNVSVCRQLREMIALYI